MAAAAVTAVVATGGAVLPSAMAETRQSAPQSGRATESAHGVGAGTVTGRQMVALLTHVLPARGKVSDGTGRGVKDKGLPSPYGDGLFEPGAWVRYDDGHGPAGIWVDVTRWNRPDPRQEPFTCKTSEPTGSNRHCTVVHLAGGAVVSLTRQDFANPQGGWERIWTATYARRDGGRVVLQESNSVYDKQLATRVNPPLTLAQLQAAVTNPVWARVIDDIPAAGAQPSNLNTPFGPDGIGAIFYRLIPSGFTIMGAQGSMFPAPGNTVVLSDAHGRGSVYNTVMASSSTAFLSTQFHKQYPTAAALPGGGWLGVKRVAGRHAGTEQFWVSVYRGHSVVTVVALNSVGPDGTRTRPAPVLSIAQLTAIAESPAWGAAN
ncbi:hypothetical protein DN069_08195 [Streptacidiphilus pinicola]|uniref:Serine hydrolase n=1 Tax=Streptacidiphilus pinicola TaxID=2219663 RepID=A0A2X0JEY4_9ACTN|nr:hypothetical protein [Streptacidiphilus pinicola]RAG86148.1 hypothetical protein DN069_08195 [Streptacidiphilus pinicola]